MSTSVSVNPHTLGHTPALGESHKVVCSCWRHSRCRVWCADPCLHRRVCATRSPSPVYGTGSESAWHCSREPRPARLEEWHSRPIRPSEPYHDSPSNCMGWYWARLEGVANVCSHRRIFGVVSQRRCARSPVVDTCWEKSSPPLPTWCSSATPRSEISAARTTWRARWPGTKLVTTCDRGDCTVGTPVSGRASAVVAGSCRSTCVTCA